MRRLGIVRVWVTKPDWGLITPSDGGPDVFVTGASARTAGVTITRGDLLEFSTRTTKRGNHEAVDISVGQRAAA